VAFRPGAPAPPASPPAAAPAAASPVAQMSLEQKMEIAIRDAPLSQGLRRELGDIKTLIASFVVVTGALMALAATGLGAIAEGITISLLLLGAAASGAQIGRGINSLIAFYRQCGKATSDQDLKRAGVAFAAGVAALGVGTLFLLLSILGARARGASGGGGAAEESAEVSNTPKTGGEPPPRPSEPTKVARRVPETKQAPTEPEPADNAYHYTRSQVVKSIKRNGLRPGSYATPAGDLSPMQAQIDLALPPNRGLPDSVLRIDLAGMRNAGYDIPPVSQVGRSFNMPGGGYEMQFPYPVPPEFITVVPK
jgi:hypothetical protein